MAHGKDITGQRFGKLLALWIAGKSGRENVWFCRCDCGQETAVRLSNLQRGNTVSCGCVRKAAGSGG